MEKGMGHPRWAIPKGVDEGNPWTSLPQVEYRSSPMNSSGSFCRDSNLQWHYEKPSSPL